MQNPPQSGPSRTAGARIAHIGIAVDGLAAGASFYRDVLRLAEVQLDDADGAAIAGFAAGDSLIELLEAREPESPIGKFVSKRGPGLHHVCFAVDDLAATLDRCRAHGIRLIDAEPRIGAEGKPIAFIHPSATSGVLVELTQV
jgi:methylmalonyl-CoA/ethylmalonyl-CoA epimerase